MKYIHGDITAFEWNRERMRERENIKDIFNLSIFTCIEMYSRLSADTIYDIICLFLLLLLLKTAKTARSREK